MLFRTNDGRLMELKKYDFVNNKLYYEKIIQIKKSLPIPKSEKTFDYKYNK